MESCSTIECESDSYCTCKRERSQANQRGCYKPLTRLQVKALSERSIAIIFLRKTWKFLH